MLRLWMGLDYLRVKLSTFVTFFLAAKPVDLDDTLGRIGKIIWITASLLATIWWSIRLYEKFFKKK